MSGTFCFFVLGEEGTDLYFRVGPYGQSASGSFFPHHAAVRLIHRNDDSESPLMLEIYSEFRRDQNRESRFEAGELLLLEFEGSESESQSSWEDPKAAHNVAISCLQELRDGRSDEEGQVLADAEWVRPRVHRAEGTAMRLDLVPKLRLRAVSLLEVDREVGRWEKEARQRRLEEVDRQLAEENRKKSLVGIGILAAGALLGLGALVLTGRRVSPGEQHF